MPKKRFSAVEGMSGYLHNSFSREAWESKSGSGPNIKHMYAQCRKHVDNLIGRSYLRPANSILFFSARKSMPVFFGIDFLSCIFKLFLFYPIFFHQFVHLTRADSRCFGAFFDSPIICIKEFL